jgi:hypothetical protein
MIIPFPKPAAFLGAQGQGQASGLKVEIRTKPGHFDSAEIELSPWTKDPDGAERPSWCSMRIPMDALPRLRAILEEAEKIRG